MKAGIPKELLANETRVAAVPDQKNFSAMPKTQYQRLFRT